MRASRKALRAARQRGLTLVEATLVLSLTGVLLAAFLPTFIRQIETSKLAEATQMLDSLHRSAAAYYEQERSLGASRTSRCLPESAGPFPAEPSSEPVRVDFAADPRGAATWRALGNAKPLSLRYSYEVAVSNPGCAVPSDARLTLRAHGDLDGDGTQSLLERSAVPAGDGHSLVPRGPLRMVSRTE
jgi:type II secretory pathway pseudopilin PulG